MKKILLQTLLCSALAFANEHDHEEIHDHLETESMMPNISLIMDVSYVNRNIEDDEAAHLEIPGIAHGILSSDSHDEHSHSINNAKNGFNLNYAELLISDTIEEIIDVEAIFHFSPGKVEIDELYFSSEALGYDSKIKAGKFRSNFGYLNQYHHHAYNFSDTPLVYEAFLGSHGINETGVQLQWKAPTPFGLMLGVEVLQGENEQMFGNESMSLPNSIGSSSTTDIASTTAPSLYIAYVKTSFELGETDILAGLSYANGSSSINHIDEEEPAAFSGDSKLYGADLLVKHHFENHSVLTWQSEWLSRDMSGDSYTYDGSDNLLPTATDKTQSGYYTQLVYELNQKWSSGARYDNIYKSDVEGDLDKYSAMLTYSPVESVFFRVQYSRNNALYEELNQQEIDTIILQANITIGHHKAHKMHDEHH